MIRTIGAEQGGSPPCSAPSESSLPSLPSVQISPQTPDPSLSPEPAEQVREEIPLLSREEKRRILAQIVRLNPLDCFDDSGAFDIARARRVLPAGAVRHIIVHETTRIDAEGQPVTQRKIHLRLVDPLSAMRLDDQLERRGSLSHARARTGTDDDTDAESIALREQVREADAARARQFLKEMCAAGYNLEDICHPPPSKPHQALAHARTRETAATSAEAPCPSQTLSTSQSRPMSQGSASIAAVADVSAPKDKGASPQGDDALLCKPQPQARSTSDGTHSPAMSPPPPQLPAVKSRPPSLCTTTVHYFPPQPPHNPSPARPPPRRTP